MWLAYRVFRQYWKRSAESTRKLTEGETVTGPIEESSLATGAVTMTAWPDDLAGVLTGAAELARAAVVEFAGADAVGEYLGVGYEDPNTATHRFMAHEPGYQGWQWAVVVATYPGADHATISEVVLIPGPTALLAPEWVPWDQRVQPGDLGPGDLLAPAKDDPRLVPGYSTSGDAQLDETALELGLGRRWVMSPWGRAGAAERWHEGDFGPNSAMSRSTKRVCRDCGFFLPLAGSLGSMFGICANELSADGHVVDRLYGCGAHSDTPAPASIGSPAYEPYDDGVIEVVERPSAEPAAVEPAAAEPAAAEVTEEPAAAEAPEVATPEIQEPEIQEPVVEEVVAEVPESPPVALDSAAAEPAETPFSDAAASPTPASDEEQSS